ncbi:MAG: hypothetical protein ACPGU5_07355 [Lishizhenia sp.]
MKYLILIIFSFTVLFSFSQVTLNDVTVNEEALALRLNQLRSVKTDDLLKAYNDTFKELLMNELQKSEAQLHPFNKLKTIGKLTSQDNSVRVFSWNYQTENEKNQYTAIVCKFDKRKKKTTVTALNKNEFALQADENTTLEPNNWYGCLYYDIIDVKKGSRTYYTLLGYEAGDRLTHTKLIDVLYFSGSTPKLGYNLFKVDNEIKKRIFMEHAKKATMTLRFDASRNKIVHDHLSPESEGLREFREYWVPDMSYDALTFTNGKWIVEEDIIALNTEENNKVTISTYDAKSDTIKQIEIKNKWESPGNNHVIALPDDNNTKVNKKTKKQKETEFNGVSFGNLGRKKKKKN